MLELLDHFDGSREAERQLTEGFERHLQAAVASRSRGDRSQVARAEAEVRSDPGRCIVVDSTGEATVRAAGRVFAGGRFETPGIAELRRRVRAAQHAGQGAARARLWFIEGVSAGNDIGALQASAPPGSMFQVASQFNCLESPEPRLVAINDYFRDSTQGPRAAISAFPGALVRHYAAPSPGGGRFVQSSDGRQVNLLADLCRRGVAVVHNGYLTPTEVADPPAFAKLLEEQFDAIRVGVHDQVEVVLGYDWDGKVGGPQRVAQAFTSTLGVGLYGRVPEGEGPFATIIRQLLRAAYLGTLLGAAVLGKRRVVLTLIGGGVFGNPTGAICQAILWAFDEAAPILPRDLTVVVNGRNIADCPASEELRSAAISRGGGFIHLDHSRLELRCK